MVKLVVSRNKHNFYRDHIFHRLFNFVLSTFLCSTVDCRGVFRTPSNILNESAKLRALRAKKVFACQRALRAYVLTCQRALRAYVLTCLACLRAHVQTCLASSSASVSCVLTSSRANVSCMLFAHLLTYLNCLCAHVPMCLSA